MVAVLDLVEEYFDILILLNIILNPVEKVVAILDLVEEYFEILILLNIILNPVEKVVAILDLVECQLIEAVTASSTFPKLPLVVVVVVLLLLLLLLLLLGDCQQHIP